ncbi:alanyl-tRNA editing protein [Falsibacillus pallidus]|uniref:Alanyl-tRNA synthetase n=1 Tax=Falsibacillus pallidus TaxID=493781 RepID=A0A370GTX3_9BACI|nr:DHHA1 domain-containing protein [Falsibacillus pallidus]RDI45994.1 alanyl-tRNA synthetase [Falsibacillus pallidus]
MTQKLYYDFPQITAWDTEIERMFEENGKCYLTLKKTAFYPEGGGQPADKGNIGEAAVLDVQERTNEIIHEVDQFPASKIVSCSIDANRRLDHTQHHSAQHLLSAVLLELYEIPTLSFHLGKEIVTIDVDAPSISDEQIAVIEKQVNDYIYDNLPIHTYYPDPDQLSSIPLRKMPQVEEDIRIVEMEGIDYSACCGTHVARTGQIGLLKIIKTEKNKKMTRIHFTAGVRSLKEFQLAHNEMTEIARHFSTSKEMSLEKIFKLEDELKNVQKELKELKAFRASRTANDLKESMNGNAVCHYFTDFDFEEMSMAASELLASDITQVLLGCKNGLKVLFAANGESEINCGITLKEHISKFNGKGGGTPQRAQGSFTQESDLLDFLTEMKKIL